MAGGCNTVEAKLPEEWKQNLFNKLILGCSAKVLLSSLWRRSVSAAENGRWG
jgi:hypothetical protein